MSRRAERCLGLSQNKHGGVFMMKSTIRSRTRTGPGYRSGIVTTVVPVVTMISRS